ncbi:hypothetical protein [Pseudacidovorax sp. RU35E]|uniref:hypothetical protein n=1 Tax=Pseudacidovorax sp. RU35E TaxID=1907403 RepID=UPI000954B6BE|nr:hypothetical protein [Pseudacidovorax sp. RU35E]SIR06432.1 hypothetical protein SAMN05880557_107290 [Pseudacidovorax sp. RU35E]
MSDPTQADKAAKQLTANDAAKLVRRTVVETVDGKDNDGNAVKVQKPKKVGVTASEVLDFKDYGSHVVVVTRDGQKLSSLDA